MRILIVNDDGIKAPGIRKLAECAYLHVWYLPAPGGSCEAEQEYAVQWYPAQFLNSMVWNDRRFQYSYMGCSYDLKYDASFQKKDRNRQAVHRPCEHKV